MDLVKSPQMSAVAAVAGLGCGQDTVAPPTELGAAAVWPRDPPADSCSPGGADRGTEGVSGGHQRTEEALTQSGQDHLLVCHIQVPDDGPV